MHSDEDVLRGQDDSTTVVPVTVPFAEESVSKIYFISTYKDSAAEGPPGKHICAICFLMS